MQRPGANEAASYYFRYIDRVTGDDPVSEMERQFAEGNALFGTISEDVSLHRYAPGKWSLREVLNHINDCERVFTFRALWFARGFDSPLPSFDQDTSARTANADQIPWAQHVEEFRNLRLATLALFQNMPAEAWTRSGIASGNPVTVRALAYIVAGHFTHHVEIIEDRYLGRAAAAR